MSDNNLASFRISIIAITSAVVGAVLGVAVGLIAAFNFTENLPFVSSSPADTSATQPRVVQVNEEQATIDAVKQVSPAVVSIVITKDLSKIYQPNEFDSPFFEFGFPFGFRFSPSPPPSGKQEIGGGTGFIVDAKRGYIVTNKHVVRDTEAEYSVLTNDGERYDAKVLARDPFNDVAILQIKAKNLTAVKLGNSDKLEMGQTVIAIGNALGEYRNTVTKGVVSGIGRTIVAGSSAGSERLEGVIQTDAAINPGNSGGPLVNLNGEVIGINTAIDREGQLIGFAIPINTVKKVIESVEKFGRIVRPYMGVRYIMINKQIAEDNNLDVDHGALIVKGEKPTDLAVIPGSPADKAGLVENDIILEVNGVKVDENNSLAKLIQQYNVGDEITLKVLHKGREKEVKLKLEEFKD